MRGFDGNVKSVLVGMGFRSLDVMASRALMLGDLTSFAREWTPWYCIASPKSIIQLRVEP